MFFRLPAMGNSAAPPKYRCPGNGQEMLARPAAIFRHHKEKAPRILRFSGLCLFGGPGGFEPQFLLRVDLQSSAVRALPFCIACFMPRWSALISTLFRLVAGPMWVVAQGPLIGFFAKNTSICSGRLNAISQFATRSLILGRDSGGILLSGRQAPLAQRCLENFAIVRNPCLQSSAFADWCRIR